MYLNKRNGEGAAHSALSPYSFRLAMGDPSDAPYDTCDPNVMIHMDPATMAIVKTNASVRLKPW